MSKPSLAIVFTIALVSLWRFSVSDFVRKYTGSLPKPNLLVSGNIEAHQSLISFVGVASQVVNLAVDEGQWVTRGAVLAQLDASIYEQQVLVREASVEVDEKQLAASLGNLVASQEKLVSDRVDLEEKRVEFGRYKKLWRLGATSTQSVDFSTAALKESQAKFECDGALILVARHDVETAEASLKETRERLRLSRLTLERTVLRAPFSGIVVVRQTELGEVVQPGSPIVTIADVDHLWMRAYVNERDLGRVHWGQKVIVTTDTHPMRKYIGRLSFISSEAEFTPRSVETHEERVTLVYRIKIDVENTNHELKPGMPADGLIQLG